MELGHAKRIAGFADITGNGTDGFFCDPGQHRQVEQRQTDTPAKNRQADIEIFSEDRKTQQPEHNGRD
ncbi:hypothetical protein D3C75_1129590 [compost metagenome]